MELLSVAPVTPYIIMTVVVVKYDIFDPFLKWMDQDATEKVMRLGPAQDVHFFYTRSYLSSLQSYALIFSANFRFIFTFK